jgi:hypothetical protein
MATGFFKVITSVLQHGARLAPLACAAHCIATPLAVALLPGIAPPGGEWPLFAAGALLSCGAAFSALRLHRRPAVAWAVLAAVAAWAASLAGLFEPLPEELTTVAACVALAAAVHHGARLRHRAACAGCGCPGHEEDG